MNDIKFLKIKFTNIVDFKNRESDKYICCRSVAITLQTSPGKLKKNEMNKWTNGQNQNSKKDSPFLTVLSAFSVSSSTFKEYFSSKRCTLSI